ncbi:MAG TPA: hypothetical protein DCP69_09465 [Candidatus Omnitrophica bacterium]|nr:hypothetical protein [Candidatus Omnitrophota bacterium]
MTFPLLGERFVSPGYARKVRAIFGSSLISYLTMGEGNGVVSFDRSGHGRHGAYIGVTLGQPGMGDGRTCPLFDGVNDYVNWYSAGLAAAFNGAEGTLGPVWIKVANAGVWTDGLRHDVVTLGVDGSNYVSLYKDANNSMYAVYAAGGVFKERNFGVGTPITFQCVTLTWHKADDVAIAYLNGAQVGATLTGLGTWSGALVSSRVVIGALNTTPQVPWFGNIQYVPLGNRALTPAEVAALAVV